MTPNDILILARAGFTAQQIAALSTMQTAPASQAVQMTPASQAVQMTPATQTAPAAQAVQTAPAGQAVQMTPAAQAVQMTPAGQAAQANPLTYEQFQQELQKMALMGTQQTGNVETADSILASIINPPANTGGNK